MVETEVKAKQEEIPPTQATTPVKPAVKKSIFKSWKFWAVGSAAIVVVGTAAFFIAGSLGTKEGLELDNNATMGVLPGVDMEQRLKELQSKLDESMIAFSINTSPYFETGKSEGNLMLENPENNAKLLVAEIYLQDSNELIYQSKAIPAGSYIEKVKLDKVLAQGEYPATVYFKGYREDDQSYIGQSGAEIVITVGR